jgi:predicted dehydrogenase
MSTQTYRAAIIGVGKAGQGTDQKGGGHQIGYVHSQQWKDNPRTELVSGADINAENLAAWQEKFQVPGGYADHHEMLEREKPDIVSICTYVGWHRRMIEDCARAGVKGIFCEKPFLASPADIAAVRGIVKETGVKIAVAHIRRHHPVFIRIRDLIRSGAIGEPLLFSAGIPGWDLAEWGSHWLDIFRFFNNDSPIRWVMGQARVRGSRGYGHALEEHAIAYWEFENGCKGFIDGGEKLTQPFAMILTGTEGDIRQIGNDSLILINGSGRKEETPPLEEDAWGSLWRGAIKPFLDWIDGGPEPELGFQNVVQTCELNLAAYISAAQGDRVDLPLTDFSLAEWPLESIARKHTHQ